MIALGHVATGLFANDDELAGELRAAGRRRLGPRWQMPLWDDYQEQLKSNFADFANIGGRPGGSITAACFLSRFAQEMRGRTSTSPAPRGRAAARRARPAGRCRCWSASLLAAKKYGRGDAVTRSISTSTRDDSLPGRLPARRQGASRISAL